MIGKRLSDCTDMDLWHAGVVSLFSLANHGSILTSYGRMAACDDDHEWGSGVEEDGERYRICQRCDRVEVHPYLLVNGVEVSRRPEGDPREPMPIAWDAPRRMMLEDMR